jgi:ribosome-binding protein aMBF1 (putative translation factor)
MSKKKLTAPTVGSRIREARERAGLLQRQLAANIDMAQSGLSLIEADKDCPTLREAEVLRAIAEATGTTVGDLLG